jgi:hypothetical protein
MGQLCSGLMGKHTGFCKMVLATIDRIEDGVLVLLTHVDPVREIHLPRELFPGFREGDVVRLCVQMDEMGKREVEKEIEGIRKGLNCETLW